MKTFLLTTDLAGSEYPRYNNIEFIRRARQTQTCYIKSIPLSLSNKKIKFSWSLSPSAQFDHDKTYWRPPLQKTGTVKEHEHDFPSKMKKNCNEKSSFLYFNFEEK